MVTFTFNDLMTKITTVFKSDMYVFNNRYCIGGEESDEDTNGIILCVLTEDCSKLIKETFNTESDVVYIKDTKKIKDNFNDFYSLEIPSDKKEYLINRRDLVLNAAMKTDSWNSFNFNDEDIDNIFNNGSTFELFTDNNDIPNVTISKSVFPLMKDKGAKEIFYNINIPDNKIDLISMITSYDTEWFQVFNLLQYVNLS